MFRSLLCSLVMFGACVGFVVADKEKSESKDKADTKAKEAKITKVDVKKDTVMVKMQSEGKEVEKTFKLAEDIEYMDSTGKIATIAIFSSGDMVLIVERDGKITKMQKRDKAAVTKKDEYTREMHKILDEFDVKCKQLEARITKSEGQAKKDLEKMLAQAKVKRNAAIKKLDELKTTGAEHWEKVKEEVKSAFDELKRMFE